MKRKTRTFSLLLTLAAFLLPLVLLTGPARAAWSGDGSYAAPYQISNVSELATFRDLVNDGETDAYAVLTADIDLGGDANEASTWWTPIGCDYSSRFSGVFDGKGHTVKGLYVDDDLEYAGLFGCVGSGGTVKNLNVEGTVKNANNSGKAGVVAGENKGTVENCRSAGTVSGQDAGGVVGSNDGTVKNCRNAAAVSGSGSSSDVGGVVGSNDGTVESCRNTGTVSGTNNVGGVVGNNYGDAATVKNCCNTGTVSGESDSRTPSTGGVVGYNGPGKPVVENCYNTGAVSSKSSGRTPATGGVVGYVAGAAPEVKNCCNVGAVSSESAGARIGGVVGCVGGTPTVKNCYNGGTVPDSGTVGGVVGHKDSGNMSDVQDFNDSLTAEQFADASSFPAEWFSEDGAWRMGGTRPLLKAFDNATAGTWDELADALRWDGTVTLTNNVTATGGDGTLVVPAGADVTLDLNGQCVDGESVTDDWILKVRGMLTLTDSSPDAAHTGVYEDMPRGGVITGNSAPKYGGGVYVKGSGAFTMSGGAITDCTASDYGGGVYVESSGAFTMSGGSITGCTAPGSGGGVFVEGSGTFTMSGGVITENGDLGVCFMNGKFSVSGAPVIRDSVMFTDSNVYCTVTGALTDGAELWVDAESGAVVARGGKLNESDDYVLTDADAACFHGDTGNGSLVGALDKDNGAAVVRLLTPWAALQARFDNASTDADAPTEITLAAGVTAGEYDQALVVPAGRYATLDLNGHAVDRGLADVNNMNDLNANNGYVLHVTGTLTLTDGSEARTGAITGGNNGTYFVDAAPGGVLVAGGGTLTMNGGAISGNKTVYGSGGGVYVANGGTLTMNGGAISGNSANGDGGGVYVETGGRFAMSGDAVISDNSASNGGGVYVYSTADEFTMSGGTISGNTANCGGGVYLNSFSGFEMTGGVITGNNASEDGGGVDCHYCSITVGGSAVISGNVKGGAKDENGVYTGGTASNALLGTNYDGSVFNPLIVGSPLDEDAAIGVTTADSGAFTSGWSTHMSGTHPAEHFTSDRAQELILLIGNEAVAAEPDPDASWITAPAGSVLVLATYDEAGRLASVKSETLDRDCIEDPTASLLGLEAGYLGTLRSFKLMLLDGKTYAPLCEAFRG